MKGLLLSAGLGTRLQPLTSSIPKCLVPIKGKPLMEYWLEILFEGGIHSILINIHYLPKIVEKYISQSRFKSVVKTVFEEKLLGTGGTLLRNQEFFGNEPIIMVHADNLSIFKIKDFLHAHENRPSKCEITMMTFSTTQPENCGILELDSNGIVKGFHEKVKNPPGNLANAAVYILEPSILKYLRGLGKEFIDFSTEVIPHFLGRIFSFKNEIYHRDIGTMESYRQAQKDFPG